MTIERFLPSVNLAIFNIIWIVNFSEAWNLTPLKFFAIQVVYNWKNRPHILQKFTFIFQRVMLCFRFSLTLSENIDMVFKVLKKNTFCKRWNGSFFNKSMFATIVIKQVMTFKRFLQSVNFSIFNIIWILNFSKARNLTPLKIFATQAFYNWKNRLHILEKL